MHTKWCHVCGHVVDLRKKGSGKFSESVTQYIPNSEYHYFCSQKCYDDFHYNNGLWVE